MDSGRFGGPAVVILAVVLVVGVLTPFVLTFLVFRRVSAANLETCSFEDVPQSFGPELAEFVRRGFVISAIIRITNKGFPDAHVLLLISEKLNAYGRLWAADRPGGRIFSLITPLRLGSLVTSTSSPDTIETFELQQVFPGASVDDLCREHAAALTLLKERRVVATSVASASAEAAFRQEWLRESQAMRHASPKLMWNLVARTVFKRHRFAGRLSEQRDIDRRIGRLATS